MKNHTLILSVYILTFLIGFPANILSLCAFSIKVRSKATPTGILLLNLTVSDLLFLLILPLKMHEAASGMRWDLPYFLCSITSFLFFSSIYSSSLLLMAVSVDRYLAVAFPINYKDMRKPLYSVVGGAITFVLSFGSCSMVFLIQHLLPGNNSVNSSSCYEDFMPSQLEVLLPVRLYFFTVLFFLPLLICAFCYLNCIRLLYTLPRISKKKRQKAVGMALSTLLVFIVCFLPYNLSHLLGYLQESSLTWRDYVLLLSTVNTCLDPIIFYYSSSAFQATITECLLRLPGCCRLAVKNPIIEEALDQTHASDIIL